MKYPYPKNEYVRYIDRWEIEPEQLSDEQNTFLFKFNRQLSNIEKEIKNEATKLVNVSEDKISDPSEWIDDYEIECFITFILKKEDQYFNEYDDNILVQLWEDCKHKDWKWGIGDNNNHNDFQHWARHPMRKEQHCWLYHSLYDHTDLGWVNILRIGSVWVDINVEYQKIFDISG